MSDWKVQRCDYSNEPNNKVKVTSLYWTVDLVDGDFTAHRYGSAGEDQKRVYTMAALSAVPASVMVKWVKQALGDEVDLIEAAMLADIEEQRNPTRGSFVPS